MKRKGARSMKDIPPIILQQLNLGKLETANLVEWLAVDQKLLLENLLRQNNRMPYLEPVLAQISQLKKPTVNTVNEAIGTALLELSIQYDDKTFLALLSYHTADLVRCWAAYTIGKNNDLNVSEILSRIQYFSADTHFGVREISWLAIRPRIIQHLTESIEILSQWTANDDENIRRFATESTRPRGVWCEHIEVLKQNPELGLPILEKLKSDPSRYVQDSVANWLNDASKTQPEFVRELCKRWEHESTTKETHYILKKAMRTLLK